jgi:hypothetical protein
METTLHLESMQRPSSKEPPLRPKLSKENEYIHSVQKTTNSNEFELSLQTRSVEADIYDNIIYETNEVFNTNPSQIRSNPTKKRKNILSIIIIILVIPGLVLLGLLCAFLLFTASTSKIFCLHSMKL